jgi:hypothetical protein
MIFVFKTSVNNKMQVRQLGPHIDKVLPFAKWNFDLKDIDKILRIDSEGNIASVVIDLLHIHRYSCEELT